MALRTDPGVTRPVVAPPQMSATGSTSTTGTHTVTKIGNDYCPYG